MSYIVILADRVHEANAHAKQHGILRGRFRFATSASSIRGLKVAEIHELPSFAKRRDRHSINAELRFVRGGREFFETPAAIVAAAIDQGDGMGEQLTIDDAPHYDRVSIMQAMGDDIEEADSRYGLNEATISLAYRAHSIFVALEGLTPEPDPEAPVEKPAVRRRARCKTCGELDFPETHACTISMRPAADKEWD